MDANDLRTELERLHPACYGWALACCDRDHDEACETLQTAYLRVLDGRARFLGRSALRTWMFGVIRMVARERRRQAGRERRVRDRSGQSLDFSDAAPSAAVDELVVALQRLSRRQREVLDLVFYQELTIEQAAQVMAVSLGTARTHYERGKARLRELLTELQGVSDAR